MTVCLKWSRQMVVLVTICYQWLPVQLDQCLLVNMHLRLSWANKGNLLTSSSKTYLQLLPAGDSDNLLLGLGNWVNRVTFFTWTNQ
jgi:hypothetical protein